MMEEKKNKFSYIAGIVGEPIRAKILYNLLVAGKALTATELALDSDTSTTSASNHLSKLLEVNILKVEKQGRYRYYTFASSEVAYALEAFLHIAASTEKITRPASGITYCRTCYDHLAGWVGVQITEALICAGIIIKSKTDKDFVITASGFEWLERNFGITQTMIKGKKRFMARQCLDWSERKIHLSGYVGALLLDKMLDKGWLRTVACSRELLVTNIGKIRLYELLHLKL